VRQASDDSRRAARSRGKAPDIEPDQTRHVQLA